MLFRWHRFINQRWIKKGVHKLQCSGDKFLWWNLDKSFFHLEEHIFICSVYIHPNNSSKEKTRDFNAFISLEEHIVKYSAYGKVILCGDFNVRNGQKQDFFQITHNNLHIDLNNCFDNTLTSDKYNHTNNRDSDTINTNGIYSIGYPRWKYSIINSSVSTEPSSFFEPSIW